MNPSLELYRLVRSGFVAQGSTLHKWCLANGVKRQNARAALLGEWRGAGAVALCLRLMADSEAQSAPESAVISTTVVAR